MSKILPSLFDLYVRKYHGSELMTESSSSSFLVQLIGRSNWSTPILQSTLMNRLTLPSDSMYYQSSDEVKRAFVQRCSYVRVSSYHSAELAEAVLLSHPTDSTSSSSSNTPPATTDATADCIVDITNNNADTDTAATAFGHHHRMRRTRIVYFSLPPGQYLPVLRALHRHPPAVKSDRAQSTIDLPVQSDGASSLLELVLEKPVGADCVSAQVIMQVLQQAG